MCIGNGSICTSSVDKPRLYDKSVIENAPNYYKYLFCRNLPV